jgi:hypothetical protein
MPDRKTNRAGTDLTRAAVEAWRDAAHRFVDAHAAAILSALDARTRTDVPTPLEQWSDAQRELWRNWLDAAGGAGTGRGAPEPGGETLAALREAAEHLIESQAEWAKAWTAAEADPGREDVS